MALFLCCDLKHWQFMKSNLSETEKIFEFMKDYITETEKNSEFMKVYLAETEKEWYHMYKGVIEYEADKRSLFTKDSSLL